MDYETAAIHASKSDNQTLAWRSLFWPKIVDNSARFILVSDKSCHRQY